MLSKMADTSISVSQDQFNCSICLDLLKDPVTIPCGHSYCMNCITDYWSQDDQRRVYSCPQCRQTFTTRPALNKNVVLTEMVERVRKTNVQTSHPDLSFAGPGDVECDVCSGMKRKAVKSCLKCLESYCQTHFDCHEQSRSNKRHKVTDARRMEEMICSKHETLLEFFCRTDQLCVCYKCALDEHKHHDTISAEAERTEKRKQTEETVILLQKMIFERHRELQELIESVQSHRISAQTAVEDSERIFSDLIRSIESRRSEVIQMIRDQEKTAVSRAEEHLKKLELEIEDLRRRDAELEQLLNTDDHICFLQNFQALSIPPGSRVSYTSGFRSYDDVRNSLTALEGKLEEFCMDIGNIPVQERYFTFPLVDPITRENFLEYFRQFTLDSESVKKHFRLSEGNRVATCTDTIQPYPDHPNRFDHWPQVLCRESVFGRCYWEVEWSGVVAITVSYKSISRKGRGNESKFGCNDQSWRLLCSPSGYFFSHNNNKSELPVPPGSTRIGVFVDHRAGILSFYSISDTMTLIHRVQTTFTQMLYPGFGINQNSSVKLCHLSV